ncbi:uncharacterized protein LOC143181789 [Calliopsis andreniformis]|uniref:uncharacterized protein LOC143181789 n=1 Tax=Calliopsis andreniformis TaxID=337506 RepID=UPI003FCD25DC
MASSSLKSTRKTYSFEEREILITLINKYEDIEDKKSDPISMCKRKSAWSQLANEYNSMVGPQGMRSAVQLRRCWENMKACKRNREEKKLKNISKSFCQFSKGHSRSKVWENRNPIPEVPMSGTVGLPPNVVFEPKESEPFTLQSVCTMKPSKQALKEENSCKNSDSISGHKLDSNLISRGPMSECFEKSSRSLDYSAVDLDKENTPEGSRLLFKSNTQTFASPIVHEQPRKTRKSLHREEELHVLALSEAQMKVDIAAMLKEEARIKLEEAHYRKEEARLRMLLFTYKLDRMKGD